MMVLRIFQDGGQPEEESSVSSSVIHVPSSAIAPPSKPRRRKRAVSEVSETETIEDSGGRGSPPNKYCKENNNMVCWSGQAFGFFVTVVLKFLCPRNQRSRNVSELITASTPLLRLTDEATKAYEAGEYVLAMETYAYTLKLYQGPTAAITTSRSDNDIDISMIKCCLNLTDCFLRLSNPAKAYEILGLVWRPQSRLAICTTHPLFVHMSRLYSRVQKELTGDGYANVSHSLKCLN